MELLGILATKYGFTANLIYGNDDWGAEVNSTWTGSIGQVLANVCKCLIARFNCNLNILIYTRNHTLQCATSRTPFTDTK